MIQQWVYPRPYHRCRYSTRSTSRRSSSKTSSQGRLLPQASGLTVSTRAHGTLTAPSKTCISSIVVSWGLTLFQAYLQEEQQDRQKLWGTNPENTVPVSRYCSQNNREVTLRVGSMHQCQTTWSNTMSLKSSHLQDRRNHHHPRKEALLSCHRYTWSTRPMRVMTLESGSEEQTRKTSFHQDQLTRLRAALQCRRTDSRRPCKWSRFFLET